MLPSSQRRKRSPAPPGCGSGGKMRITALRVEASGKFAQILIVAVVARIAASDLLERLSLFCFDI
jgi:hypothetical protein